jgi:uncharacterized membrane protein (UPF0182 family)
MRNWNRSLAILSTTVIVLLLILAVAIFLLSDFLVDLWWFSSLDYESYFWRRTLYRYILYIAATGSFFSIFFLHFWIASRFLGVDTEGPRKLTDKQAYARFERITRLFQKGSVRFNAILSLILAIVIAIPFYRDWELALLFLFGREANIKDPAFSTDIGFYLFWFPFFHLIQNQLLLIALALSIAVTLLYWLEHHIIPEQKVRWPTGAKAHITVLFLITACIKTWGFQLDQYSLLYTDRHEPAFFGPGFVEIRYYLPLIWIAIASFLSATICAVLLVHTGLGPRAFLGFCLSYLATVALSYVDAIPKSLDRFLVQPNPVRMQKRFINSNIRATLTAFDLKRVSELNFAASKDPKAATEAEMQTALGNIPVWDVDYLDDVYKQLQSLRPYYDFPSVDVARYTIGGRTEQVNLAARELSINKLPKAAQNWENIHLRYTHGLGAVMTPAAQMPDEPMHWYLRDLSLNSEVGMAPARPEVNYGLGDLEYVVVPNKLHAGDVLKPASQPEGLANQGGILISSLFKKLLLAVYLEDEKFFFSPNIGGKSRLLLRRNVIERIKRLTPYLVLDSDPYLVVTKDRLYWIQEAFTLSRWYPVSKFQSFRFGGEEDEQQFNYIRDAVRVVVDAFDGSVHYYVSDPSDPIIQAYRRAYGEIFKDIKELQKDLQSQLRYPKDLLTVQMRIYARYHQRQPEQFFQQAETWEFAQAEAQTVQPYYLTIPSLACPGAQNFVSVLPMTPIARNNLSAVAVAGGLTAQNCKASYENQIVLYRFRKEDLVEGPSQVNALIDQDPEISRQFSLWNMSGSRVKRGRMIILPVGRSIIYVQPVFLISATGARIPELTRVILVASNKVIMDTSLEKAFQRLRNTANDRQTSQMETYH